MAAIQKLPSGKRRAIIRRRDQYTSQNFIQRKDAEMWARRIEREIDIGRKPTSKAVQGIRNFADLIDLHIAAIKAVGRRKPEAGSRKPEAEPNALFSYFRETDSGETSASSSAIVAPDAAREDRAPQPEILPFIQNKHNFIQKPRNEKCRKTNDYYQK